MLYCLTMTSNSQGNLVSIGAFGGDIMENRIDEALKSGACDECIHCVQMKRTKKCDDTLTKTGKYISCREIRVCNAFNRTYKVEGL